MMGFTCECDYDGDASEWEWYWEFGGQQKPKAGQICCECNAPLPAIETLKTPLLIIYSEPKFQAFVMNEFMTDEEAKRLGVEYDGFDSHYGIPLPIDVEDEVWDGGNCDPEEFADDYVDAFSAETGWRLNEYERWERVSETMLRCERCDGLAEAYTGTATEGGLGYCDPGPGDLIGAHIDMVSTNNRRIKWPPNKNGVLNPRPWTWWEYLEFDFKCKMNRVKYWLSRGWKYSLKRKTVIPYRRLKNKITGRNDSVYR